MIPRLTVNLGVRYDVQTAPTDTRRRIAVFSPGTQSTVSPLAIPGQLFPGDPGVPAGGTATNYNHISPRLGFAFDPYGSGKDSFSPWRCRACSLTPSPATSGCSRRTSNPFAVRETSAFTHVSSLSNI